MAEGDLIVKNHQYEYRGLLFGSSTLFMVLEVNGLLSTPGVKSEDHFRSDFHGEFNAPLLLSSRFIEVRMRTLHGPTSQADADAVQQLLSDTFLPTNSEHLFAFSRPASGTRYCKCRVHDRVIPSVYELAKGVSEVNIMLKATDPLIYSLTQLSESITASGTVVHMGNYPMYPIIELDGPFENPRILHVEQDRMVGFGAPFNTLVGSSGQTLVIDSYDKTAELDGVDVYDKIIIDNQWWMLEPGTNTIQNYDSTGAGSTLSPGGVMRIKHRDTWV